VKNYYEAHFHYGHKLFLSCEFSVSFSFILRDKLEFFEWFGGSYEQQVGLDGRILLK
jgi:hypothetical protein